MPTVRTDPRFRAVHYFYRALERIDIIDTISISLRIALLKGSGIRSKSAVLRKHPRFRSLAHFFIRSRSILYKSSYCLAIVLFQEMMRLKSYTIYPSDPNLRNLPRLDSTVSTVEFCARPTNFRVSIQITARFFYASTYCNEFC